MRLMGAWKGRRTSGRAVNSGGERTHREDGCGGRGGEQYMSEQQRKRIYGGVVGVVGEICGEMYEHLVGGRKKTMAYLYLLHKG
jgi:hypothetical protein